VDVVKSLRSQLAQSQKDNAELSKEVKSMNRIQKEQAHHLEKLHDKTDYINKIKMLSEENRAQSEMIRDLEAKLRLEREEKRIMNDKIKHLEKELDECRDMLEEKSGEYIAKTTLNELKDKVDKFKTENQTLKKINEGQAAKYLKQNARHLKEVNGLKEETKENQQ
jgi:hypothetical protein